MKSILQMWTWLLLSFLSTGDALQVQRVYVPEEHFLLLVCGRSPDARQGLSVEWRHGLTRVDATEHRSGKSQPDGIKHQVFPNGTLYIRDLQETDSGLYYCDGRLAADVTVLTGNNFVVYEGRTLYLSCKSYGKTKQRWMYKRRPDSKREFISSWFKNGTLRQEREDPDGRFLHTHNHLQLLRLQPSDSGFYLCNGNEIASVLVQRTESDTAQTATTENTETRNTITQMTQNVMLVTVLAVFLLAVVVVILLSMSIGLIRSRRKDIAPKAEEPADLQLQKKPGHDPSRGCCEEEHSMSLTDQGEIQYASLGRQNWRSCNWSKNTGQQVIYSTLLLTPSSSLPHTSANLRQ